MKRTYRRPAFTLVELLLVLSIVAITAAIIFTAASSTRWRSHEAVCISQLRQIGAAIKMYQNDHDDLPVNLDELYPTYTGEKDVFRCPAWDSLISAKPRDQQESSRTLLTMYAYQRKEKGFWQKVPYEPGDPVVLREGWDSLYNRRGEATPLVTCQFHDPYLLSGEVLSRNGRVQMVRLILRTDGSVSKVTKYFGKEGGGVSDM